MEVDIVQAFWKDFAIDTLIEHLHTLLDQYSLIHIFTLTMLDKNNLIEQSLAIDWDTVAN